jgi:hypothetical protein
MIAGLLTIAGPLPPAPVGPASGGAEMVPDAFSAVLAAVLLPGVDREPAPPVVETPAVEADEVALPVVAPVVMPVVAVPVMVPGVETGVVIDAPALGGGTGVAGVALAERPPIEAGVVELGVAAPGVVEGRRRSTGRPETGRRATGRPVTGHDVRGESLRPARGQAAATLRAAMLAASLPGRVATDVAARPVASARLVQARSEVEQAVTGAALAPPLAVDGAALSASGVALSGSGVADPAVVPAVPPVVAAAAVPVAAAPVGVAAAPVGVAAAPVGVAAAAVGVAAAPVGVAAAPVVSAAVAVVPERRGATRPVAVAAVQIAPPLGDVTVRVERASGADLAPPPTPVSRVEAPPATVAEPAVAMVVVAGAGVGGGGTGGESPVATPLRPDGRVAAAPGQRRLIEGAPAVVPRDGAEQSLLPELAPDAAVPVPAGDSGGNPGPRATAATGFAMAAREALPVAAPVSDAGLVVDSEALGAVEIGVEGGGQDLRVRLSGSSAAAGAMAAEAPRLLAELTAAGLRVQSLAFDGRVDAGADAPAGFAAGSGQPGAQQSGSGQSGFDRGRAGAARELLREVAAERAATLRMPERFA